MSKLIKNENKVKALLTPLCFYDDLRNKSPFNECNDNTEQSGVQYHLGECPSLIHNLPNNQELTIKIVCFTVITPNNHPPFLMFYFVKNTNDELVFPVLARKKDADVVNANKFLHNLGVSYNEVGHFSSDEKATYYSIYELNTKYNNKTTSGYWLTVGEVISGLFLSSYIHKEVVYFISNKSEGIIRLYKEGVFIPSPRIMYCCEDDTHYNNFGFASNTKMTIGDLNYGLFSSFFHSFQECNTSEYKTFNKYPNNNGIISRVAFWEDGNQDEEQFCIVKSGVNNKKCSYSFLTVLRNSCYMISRHYGTLNGNTADMVKVINEKMFLFD